MFSYGNCQSNVTANYAQMKPVALNNTTWILCQVLHPRITILNRRWQGGSLPILEGHLSRHFLKENQNNAIQVDDHFWVLVQFEVRLFSLLQQKFYAI